MHAAVEVQVWYDFDRVEKCRVFKVQYHHRVGHQLIHFNLCKSYYKYELNLSIE